MTGERTRWLRTKLSRLFRRGKHEAELDAEMQFHFDQLVAELRGEGLSEEEARLAARREMGEVSAYREEVRDAWRPPELADLWRTIRFAGRSLARSPGLTLLAIVTLAFGIGANTAMFTVYDSVVARPLPYAGHAELDRIDRATPQNPEGRLSPPDFLELRREAAGRYEQLVAYANADATLSDRGQPSEIVRAVRTTADFFPTLRVEPQLGRDFLPGEDAPGHDRVVILSHRCWQNRFGGRADIIGRSIRIDGVPHDVIGVLPASFNDWRHLGSIDLFRPLALDPRQAADRGSTILRVIGRRPVGLARADADGFVSGLGARLAADFPDVNAGTSWRRLDLDQTGQGKDARVMVQMLIGLSGFVLLIACSNLANLLLARTVARARELAIRAALGASRGQLLRPLIAESLLLAFAGGGCALLVAQWGIDWLAVRSTGDNGERVTFMFGWHVFGWALAAAIVTALAFSVAPALFAMRLDMAETLKSGARGVTGGRGHQRFRHALVVGQFALAMILLAGAALFIRGLDELNHRRAGWQSDHLVTARIALPPDRYPDAERISAFQRRAVERLQALPGVASASLAAYTPFFDWLDLRKLVVVGRQPPARGREPAAIVNGVTPRYFDTVGTRLVAGRAFDDRDGAAAPRVYIINQAMAAVLFGDESPLGKRLAFAGGEEPRPGEIVGVVADIRPVVPDPSPVTFQVYQSMAQEPRRQHFLAVRTAGVAPAAVVEGIRAAMNELDPDLPLQKLQPADATIDRANYDLGVLRDILSSFAVLGLALALLGIYGVIARTMAQRSSEFAIRYALGARAIDVTQIVLASGLKLALIGAALGLGGALGVSRLLAFGFPGMHLDSPPVLAGTTLLLIVVAVLASWIPARRAARIQPMQALRAD